MEFHLSYPGKLKTPSYLQILEIYALEALAEETCKFTEMILFMECAFMMFVIGTLETKKLLWCVGNWGATPWGPGDVMEGNNTTAMLHYCATYSIL